MPDKKKNPYDINVILELMTLDLIASLKRTSLRHKKNEMDESFRWEQWQSAKLRAMNEYRKRNRKIVTAAMKEAEELVDVVLEESFKAGEQKHVSLWRRFVNWILKPFGFKRVEVEGEVRLPVDFKESIKPHDPRLKIPYAELPKAPPEEQFFRMNEKKLEALQETVKNDLKKAQHGVLRKMDDVYRQVIYKAEMNMAAGAKTLPQAIDMATKEFLSKGINSIDYSNGRRVSITAYAEMALRTASQRATFLGEGKKRDEWGVYTVVMSAHANCSPMCLPYQGTVMIDDVYTSLSKEDAAKLAKETGYVLLSEAMKNYAFHPNCRHTLATFFPGISSVPQPVDDEKAIENYNAEQRQRYMERQIRKYKRLEAGTLDENTQAKYSAKVKEWQSKLREHLKANPQLRRDYSREKVQGGLVPKERTEILRKSIEREKIEEIRGHIQSDAQPKRILEGQQNKHIAGTHEYKQEQDRYSKKEQYGPSRLELTQEEIEDLVKRYAGTGEVKFTKAGNWDKKETILSNDKIVGKAVNNRTGAEAETTVFKIHYGKNGIHIVPDYPSKKRKR